MSGNGGQTHEANASAIGARRCASGLLEIQ